MRDLFNLHNFYNIDIFNKSSKKPYITCKSFGYQVLGFGSGGASGPPAPTQKAIFGFGAGASYSAISNLVSSSGVVATDTAGVGTARNYLACVSYGGDKAIFAFGYSASSPAQAGMSNLVSNSGVVSSDVTAVGSARNGPAGCSFGSDGQAVIAYGNLGGAPGVTSISNLISSVGVVSSDVTGVGTVRVSTACAPYGVGLGIFCYGNNASVQSNKVSNLGVVAADVSAAGTRRWELGGCGYGTDKGIFWGGYPPSGFQGTNLVTNLGVIGSDVTAVGTGRQYCSMSSYGGDKAIGAFGAYSGGTTNISNLISSSGVMAADTTGVGTARQSSAAAGYSQIA